MQDPYSRRLEPPEDAPEYVKCPWCAVKTEVVTVAVFGGYSPLGGDFDEEQYLCRECGREFIDQP